tara:strand:+ start:81 stop:470 length:390 start_codon:yes stop_codon:yes gene_type:complete
MYWGPPTWQALHCICAGPASQEAKLAFIHALGPALPCAECGEHTLEYIGEYPPEKATDLFQWSVDFHNAVNEKLGKPVRLGLTPQIVCAPPTNSVATTAIVAVVTSLIGYVAGRYSTDMRVVCEPSSKE